MTLKTDAGGRRTLGDAEILDAARRIHAAEQAGRQIGQLSRAIRR